MHRLPIPSFKLFRLLLPLAVFIAGTTIFLCGTVRTYHLPRKETRTVEEERFVNVSNEHMEWWVGFVLMVNASLAVTAVLVDKPFLFKISVICSGCCLVLAIYAILWDAGEFSMFSQQKHLLMFLEENGHTCFTNVHNFTMTGVSYTFHDCECKKGAVYAIDFFIPFSCELLNALYYLHAVLAFALSCAVAFILFTIFSFVLILKRISQITTALHLDEKPLSDDFANISGDLYIDS